MSNHDLDFLDRMTLLAIDAGSEWAGYCIGRGMRLIDSGRTNITQFTRRQDGDPYSVWSRVEYFGVFATALVATHRPDVLVMELPTGDHDNRHTDRVMGALLGSLVSVANLANARRVVCTPREVQGTGYHKRAKRDAALFAEVPREEMKDDWADAIGLWQAGLIKVRDVLLLGTHDFAAIDVVRGETVYVVN